MRTNQEESISVKIEVRKQKNKIRWRMFLQRNGTMELKCQEGYVTWCVAQVFSKHHKIIWVSLTSQHKTSTVHCFLFIVCAIKPTPNQEGELNVWDLM